MTIINCKLTNHHMFQKLYSVYSDNYDNCTLFIEAGKKFIACWCRNNDSKKITGFELFQLDKTIDEELSEEFNNIKQLSMLMELNASAKNFIWNSPQSVCIPSELYSDELATDYAHLAIGQYHEAVTYIQTHEHTEVLSIMPGTQQQSILNTFPGALLYHHHYCLLASIPDNDKPVIYLFFYPGSFTLLAYKHGVLQLIQTRDFTTAEEVLYYLLNVYHQYNFLQHETAVYTAGYLDETSDVYRMLYQYIEGIQLQQPRHKTLASAAFDEYRPHVYLPFVHYNI